MCYRWPVEVREQMLAVSSLRLPGGFQGLNLGCQASLYPELTLALVLSLVNANTIRSPGLMSPPADSISWSQF